MSSSIKYKDHKGRLKTLDDIPDVTHGNFVKAKERETRANEKIEQKIVNEYKSRTSRKHGPLSRKTKTIRDLEKNKDFSFSSTDETNSNNHSNSRDKIKLPPNKMDINNKNLK